MRVKDGLVPEEVLVGRPQHPQTVVGSLRSSQDSCQQEGASVETGVSEACFRTGHWSFRYITI